MKLRMRAALALTLVPALALAGCSGSSDSADGAKNGNVTVWMTSGGSAPAIQAAFDRWNKDNPDAKISFETYADNAFKEKIRTAVGSGNAPTLITSWGGATMREYVKSGKVVDLTDKTKEFQSRLAPSILKSGEVDGKLYAAPTTAPNPVFVYYNKAVLKKAGVDVPKDWDSFLAAIKGLKAAGVTPIALGGQSRWPYLMYIQYLTDRIGGPEVFDAVLEGKPNAWSHPAIKQALEKIQELAKMGAFGDAFGSVEADSNADLALLYTGKAGMLMQGNWAVPDFRKNAPEFANNDLGYMAFPAIPGGKGDPRNITGNPSNYYLVSADATAAAQEAAIGYLNKVAYDDQYVDDMMKIGYVPAVPGLEEKLQKAENPEYLTFLYKAVQEAPNFQLSWDQALPSAQADELLTSLSQIFLGQITPDQFVENMNATLQ